MTNVILCPNCHGSKLVSTPPMIAGRSRHSYDSSGTETYPCPVCDGKGWIDSDADSDVATMKTIVLSAMETAENLMDECVIRGERIKDLETKVDGKDDVIVRLMEQRTAIRKDCAAHRDALRIMVDERDEQITSLKSKNNYVARDIMLLDVILKTVNPILKSDWGNTQYFKLGEEMADLCDDVTVFRRKHETCIKCGQPLGNEYGDARMNDMCVDCSHLVGGKNGNV